jgi:hypothetical protein
MHIARRSQKVRLFDQARDERAPLTISKPS